MKKQVLPVSLPTRVALLLSLLVPIHALGQPPGLTNNPLEPLLTAYVECISSDQYNAASAKRAKASKQACNKEAQRVLALLPESARGAFDKKLQRIAKELSK